jgi:hypothetical protein
MDWIRSPLKRFSVCSIIWKAFIKSFEVVGEGLACRVGNDHKVHLSADPWPGSGRSHLLNLILIQYLKGQGFFYLNKVVYLTCTIIWGQEWIGPTHFGLIGEETTQWTDYACILKSSHI